MEGIPSFTGDTHISEAARAIFAAELATIKCHEPALLENAEVTAVHETRKAIRRSYTAVRLFRSYFEPGLLDRNRRQLRKLMRRLAPCRDMAVFLQKLALFAEENGPQPEIKQYWQSKKAAADETLQDYWRRSKWQAFLQWYEDFTSTPGMGVLEAPEKVIPIKVRHLAPALLYERVATVLAYDAHLEGASLTRLHELRIQGKELRYALGFFAPLAGPEIEKARATLKELQELLGNLNDATVALKMLDDVPRPRETTADYRFAKTAEIEHLIDGLPRIWARFDSTTWRRQLAVALAVL